MKDLYSGWICKSHGAVDAPIHSKVSEVPFSIELFTTIPTLLHRRMASFELTSTAASALVSGHQHSFSLLIDSISFGRVFVLSLEMAQLTFRHAYLHPSKFCHPCHVRRLGRCRRHLSGFPVVEVSDFLEPSGR
jgi:hypothetical protein